MRSISVANAFHDLGLRAGDPVAFCIENRSEFAVLLWACHDAGYRYTPISTRLTPDEVAYIVDDCGAAVFLHSQHTAAAGASVAALDGVGHVIDIDGHESLDSGESANPRYERAEGIGMLYSSGTTGKPKGVWRAAPDEPVDELGPADRAAAQTFGITPDSVYLSPAPLYHSAPITFLIQMGRIGAATVIMERFDPAESLATIERYRVTHSQWVPTMFVACCVSPTSARPARPVVARVRHPRRRTLPIP